MKYLIRVWFMDEGSETLKIKSLLFLSFSAKCASKIPISYLLRSLEEVAEDTHSRKLGVRVVGVSLMMLSVASRRGVVQMS